MRTLFLRHFTFDGSARMCERDAKREWVIRAWRLINVGPKIPQISKLHKWKLVQTFEKISRGCTSENITKHKLRCSCVIDPMHFPVQHRVSFSRFTVSFFAQDKYLPTFYVFHFFVIFVFSQKNNQLMFSVFLYLISGKCDTYFQFDFISFFWLYWPRKKKRLRKF